MGRERRERGRRFRRPQKKKCDATNAVSLLLRGPGENMLGDKEEGKGGKWWTSGKVSRDGETKSKRERTGGESDQRVLLSMGQWACAANPYF